MRLEIEGAWKQVGPILALGLFSSRLFAEQILAGSPVAPQGLTTIAALILVMAAVAIAWFLLRRAQFSRAWPLLFLTSYALYPESEPRVAVAALLMTLLVALQKVNLPGGFLGGKDNANTVANVILLVGFAILYMVTLAPDVLPADNGEFQLVGYTLGVAHPPGFPLYTLLAYAISHLPLGGSPALRINVLSVVFSTLALLITYWCVFRMTGRRLSGFVAAIALGTSTTFWAQATTANIRSLTGLFAALSLFLLVRLYQTVQTPGRRQADSSIGRGEIARSAGDRLLVQLSLVLSFGILHHASLLFMGLIFLAFVLVTDPLLLRSPGRLFRPVLVGLIGFIPLIYLPWRGLALSGGAEVPGATAGLTSVEGFLDHALALGFRGDFFYFVEPAVLWERLKVMGNVMSFQFDLPILAGMAVGFALMLWRARRYALLFAGSFVVHTLVTATYRAPQTVEYMLPAYIPAAIALGYGAGCALQLGETRQSQTAVFIARSFLALLFVAAVNQGVANYPSFRRQHDASPTRAYVESLLDDAPPGAVLLADWHWVTPLWYVQEVEGRRTDLSIQYVFPTSEPYAETWSRRIREELDTGRPVVSTHFEEHFYTTLPPPQPLGDAFLYPLQPLEKLPDGYQRSEIGIGEAIQVVGFHTREQTIPVGEEMALTIAWQTLSETPPAASLFAHLVGADGRIYAQDDSLARPQAQGITLTQFRLTPRLGALPGDYEILIGAYGEDPLVDAQGRARTPLTSAAVIPMSFPPVTGHQVNRPVAGAGSGRRLIGYDWDTTFVGQRRLYLHWQEGNGYYTETWDVTGSEALDLPAMLGPWGVARSNRPIVRGENGHYVPFGRGIVWTGSLTLDEASLQPGSDLLLRQTFRSNRPVLLDIATSVRLIGYEENDALWAWSDLDGEFGIPAMGAIPTLKWIAGSSIHDPHVFTVETSAYPGQTVGVTVVLYETISGRPLPVLDERFGPATPWRLASIRPPNE